MKPGVLCGLAAMVVMLAACGGGTGGSGGTGGTGGSGGSGGDGGSDGGGGVGVLCGEAGQCAAGEYCSWHYRSCGDSSIDFQECVTKPASCGESEPLVCACDGKVYDSYCDAIESGTTVGYSGGCPPPEGMFACGSTFCKSSEQYCRKQQVGDAFKADCLDLPEGCSSCDCVPGVVVGGDEDDCTCMQSGASTFVECPPSL